MIVRSRPRGWELIGIWRLSILSRIWPLLLVTAVFSSCVVLAAERFPAAFHTFNVAPFTLLGIALSIFLGFRNSACYDRWWEARRQLGALIGEMRSFARLLIETPGGDRVRRVRVVRRAIGYVYALMAHLRGRPMSREVALYVPDWDSSRATGNVPDALLRGIAAETGAMFAAGEFGEMFYLRLDERLSSFAAMQVACERIKGTPTPFPYTLLLHRTAYAFCFLLPFGLVGTLRYATPLFSAVVAYAFFGLDALGDELQEPFGEWLNALPLTAMARTVEISLLETVGESKIPNALEPVRSVLQ
ncbi:putative membrane protein [Terriglobus roseus DSM 18391]|uniref:Putative membrane protein n=1 Tax=Terriglobus roseus (strain DSM 18391 / NRRL B-41598 / KBS 63) TaxID=926566 RepID=I3ZD09_TERRK|nr:bestrophin family protein [Terriglobus roseus]AFL87127.1 putative membrane protein [Terriglobus roseus DSM 18391]